MKYKLKWKALKTGAEGEGKPIFDSYEMAKQIADELTIEQRYMIYYVESVADNEESVDENPGTAGN